MPLGVTTSTVPLAAPGGTVVVIRDGLTTVNVAAVPLKATLVAPVRCVPSILISVPAAPDAGIVSTNGPKPTGRLKTVPSFDAPPHAVLP